LNDRSHQFSPWEPRKDKNTERSVSCTKHAKTGRRQKAKLFWPVSHDARGLVRRGLLKGDANARCAANNFGAGKMRLDDVGALRLTCLI
jgi:hypothetical protein